MKTRQYPKGSFRAAHLRPLPWSVIAIVLLVLASPFVARAQISQIGVLPGLPNPTKTAVWNQNNTTIYQATGNQNTRIPFGFSVDVDSGGTIVKKVLMSWGVNPDFINGNPAPAEVWRRSSLNGGLTWGAVDTNAGSNGNVSYLSAIRRRNGEMVALSYTPSEGYFKSTDNGVSWTNYTCTVPLTMKFHRGIIEEPNPTDPNIHDLFAVGYSGWDCVLLKSTNGGANWTYVSTPANGNTDGDGRRYNESTIERCSDGSWLVVSRDEWYTATSEMRWRRSTNQGQSWIGTGTSELAGLPAPESDHVRDCDPYLKLMPNGVLVLTYGPTNANDASGWPGGSRDCHVAFSVDGKGASWTNHVILLKGSTATVGLESSGYGGAIPVSAHRFLTYSDTGQSWSYSTEHPTPNPYTIWGRYVDIVRTNQQNRIDLKAKYAAGALTIMSPATDLTYTTSVHPEARLTGAFDGSTDYWSGAFKSGTSGTYQLDLQQTYNLTGVGICLSYNTAESATVETSPDNSTWTARKTYAGAKHNALDYTMFTSTPVRYVRVRVQGAGTLISLNELELYQAESTFENNAAHAIYTGALPHGTLPPGYVADGTSSTQYGFYVKDGTGYQSNRALELWDSSSLWRAGIKKTVTATTSKQWTFRYKPVTFSGTGANGHTFKITGNAGATPVTAYSFAIMPDGRAQYLVLPSTWTNITGFPAGTIAANSWYELRVDAGLTSAQISVNGFPKGTFPKAVSSSLTNLNGFGFGSTGTATSGDKANYDDVFMN